VVLLNKAVFLDRDGTLTRDVPYCSRPEDLHLLPTVAEGLALLNRFPYKIILITNQSGIARGYFDEVALASIHTKLKDDICREGGRLDAIYYCPHHPQSRCHCRKPETGMIETAARDWDLVLADSYFIGDKYLDIEAANRSGCKAVLVPSEAPETQTLQGDWSYPGRIEFVGRDFLAAVNWLTKEAK